MYRFCPECSRPRWWPESLENGECGHRFDSGEWTSNRALARCDPDHVRVSVRIGGRPGRLVVAPGAEEAFDDDLRIAVMRVSDGRIAVRVGIKTADRWIVDWTPISGSISIPLSRDRRVDDAVLLEIDLHASPARDTPIAGQKCLEGLPVGRSAAVIAADARLATVQADVARLLLIPREDNCLRAICLDSTGFFLNGDPFVLETIRPGDVLGTRTHAWRWHGLDGGFRPATGLGTFEVQCTGLSLEKRVVDFTCSFRSGELSVVLGGSGSGKTTLVRMVAGVLLPTSGSMRLRADGRDLEFPCDRLEDFAVSIARHVSYIPQDDAVLPELTVRQAIEYAYLLHPANRGKSRSRQAIAERISFLLRSLGLEEHADKVVERLSGGQRKRVSLALGLVGDPELVILDEPTSGLDFDNERRTMILLRRLARQGKAVVVVTHSLDSMQFADQCLVVRAEPGGSRIVTRIRGQAEVAAAEMVVASVVAPGDPVTDRLSPAATVSNRRRMRTARPRFVELVARGFRQWINSPRSAAVAFLLLPLVLGIMVRLGSGVYLKDRLAIGLVAIFWLGVNQSVRDLLKDIDVIRREDLDGTSPTRQVLARACFGAITSLVGAIMMTAPFHWISVNGWTLELNTSGEYLVSRPGGLTETLLPWWVSIAWFWAAGLMGNLIGLSIAGLCSFANRKAESIAVLASVLITLPQFLYSEKCLHDGLTRDPGHFGLFFETWHSTSERIPDMLSFLTVTRWTFLPMEAHMERIGDPRVFRLSGAMLAAGAAASLIITCFSLSASISLERGAGWLPRRRGRAAERKEPA